MDAFLQYVRFCVFTFCASLSCTPIKQISSDATSYVTCCQVEWIRSKPIDLTEASKPTQHFRAASSSFVIVVVVPWILSLGFGGETETVEGLYFL